MRPLLCQRIRRPDARRLLALLSLVVPLSACDQTITGIGKEKQVCRPSLGTTSAGRSVEVVNVPEVASDSLLYAYVRVIGTRQAMPVVAERQAGGAIRVQVPPHPTSPMTGGAAELVLGAGELKCEAVAMILPALAPAPGASEQTVAGLQASLQAMQEALGVSPEILRGDPAQVPAEFRSLAAAQWLLDHPGNPNSLVRMLEGSAPALQGRRVEPALLDAVLASEGIPALLGRIQAHMERMPTVAATSGEEGWSPSLSAAQDTVAMGVRGVDFLMAQRAHLEAIQPQVEELLQKTATLFALTVVLPGLQVFAPVAMVTGGVFWIGALMYDGQMKLLPRHLDPLQAKARPLVMGEDAPANAGDWTDIRLFARSDDWTFTIPRVVDGGLALVGGELGKKGAQAMQWTLQRLMRSTGEVGSEGLKQLGEVLNVAFGLVNQALQNKLAEEHFYQPARVYGPMDASEYVEGYLPSEGVLRLYPEDSRFFGPVAPGKAQVGLRTQKKYFQGKQAQAESTIEVTAITLRVTPAADTLAVGESVTFQAKVEGAHNHAQSVVWSASGGTITEEGKYTAPPFAGTYTITASHPTKTERKAQATVVVLDPEAAKFVSIDAGGAHSCGVLSDGRAYCWGANQYGMVGDGTDLPRLSASQVLGGATWKELSASSSYTCGISKERRAYCWGSDNLFGQLGIEITGRCTSSGREFHCNPSPTPVFGDHEFVTISAGDHRTCALTPGGKAYCWGAQVGDGTTTDRKEPTPVAGGHVFSSLRTYGTNTCGLTPMGKAYCWGIQVGDGTEEVRLVPTAVSGGLVFAKIDANSYHMCGVTPEGEGYCWGRNLQGRLGDGTSTDRLVPTRVMGNRKWADIRTGAAHTCGLTTEGRVYCWGAWHGGTSMQDVSGVLRFKEISAGISVSCGITREGLPYCWGYGEGAMGDGTMNASSVPVAVKGW